MTQESMQARIDQDSERYGRASKQANIMTWRERDVFRGVVRVCCYSQTSMT